MATGDLTNNIRKLQKELKSMKYQETLDLSGYVLKTFIIMDLICQRSFVIDRKLSGSFRKPWVGVGICVKEIRRPNICRHHRSFIIHR